MYFDVWTATAEISQFKVDMHVQQHSFTLHTESGAMEINSLPTTHLNANGRSFLRYHSTRNEMASVVVCSTQVNPFHNFKLCM